MAKLELGSPAELEKLVGQELGTSDWIDVTQEKVNAFADATGDHQWIHVDVERAKKESPFGGTIAHGYWTVATIAQVMFQILSVKSKLVVNYGLNRVRFPAPVHVGKRVRGHAKLKNYKDLGGSNAEVEFEVKVEVEGTEKPACVAEIVYRYYA
ncbi:MAG: 3-hydroxyacyl-thioester dehydratase HtdZ [Promethearchaeota archaeon]